MGFLAAIPAIASVASSILGAKSASNAADAATAGEERRLQLARESRDLARADLQPWRRAGESALDAALSMVGLPSISGGGGAGISIPGETRFNAADMYRPQQMDAGHRSAGANGRASSYGVDAYRANGGPVRPVSNYYGTRPANVMVGEQGPETYTDRHGRSRQVGSRGPEVIQVNEPGYISPNPNNPQSATTENPGGQPGRYNFMTDPGYNFRYDEGARALERQASARGRLRGGAMDRALVRYGQGVASQEYQNVYNRISSIAQMGQNAAAGTGSAALSTGQTMGDAAAAAGSARASGYIGANNQIQNGINSGVQLWGQYQNGREPSNNPYNPYGFEYDQTMGPPVVSPYNPG